MDHSPSIDLIWRLAAQEMAAGEFNEIQPEHFCMALLKFAEITVKAPEDDARQAELAKAIAEDAQLVRQALQKCGIESTSPRRKLRKQLGKGGSPQQGGKVHRSTASRVLFETATALAAESGNLTLTPLHLLTALVQSPTPAIAQAVLGKPAAPSPPAALPLIDKHGQDLVKEVAEGKLRIKPGLEAQSKAVLQALQQKDRISVVLLSESNDVMFDLAVALATRIAAKDAPQGLKGRRLMDVTPRAGSSNAPNSKQNSPKKEYAEIELMRQLLAEAAAHPEIILVVPAAEADPNQARGGPWTNLLKETLVKGKAQFICRVTPLVFTEHLRKDAVWKQRAQAVWLERTAQGSVPREL